MRGTIGLAAKALAAAAFAVFVTTAGCTPVQWDFVFVEEFPAKDDPSPEFIVPVDGLDPAPDPAVGFTDSRDLEPQTGVEEGSELYLTSLSFSIAQGSPQADFSSVDWIEVRLEPQSGGTSVIIASLPSGDPQFQPGVTTIDLVPKLVDLADYISVPYRITVTIEGVGPPTELWYAGEAIFSGTKTL